LKGRSGWPPALNPSSSSFAGNGSAETWLRQAWSKLRQAISGTMRSNRLTAGLGPALLCLLALPAVPAAAQYGASAISDPNAVLADSLKRLSREPKNLEALIAAGRASLELGDLQSAAGFFGRADEAYPSSPYPKIGMGAALAMGGDASGALAMFDRAQALGAPPSVIALDRGLAFDLLGRQPEAQAQYRMALSGTQADEARRRLALSLAIARDIPGASATIEPLLARRDQAAVRVNAFVLALAGDREGARRTIDAAMPGAGARFEPFFKMLPVLRPNEKAAAVHLGEFPKDAEQRYARAEPVPMSPVVSLSNRDPGRIDPPKPGFTGRRAEAAKPAPAKPAPQRSREERAPQRVAEAPRRAVREARPANTYIAMIRPSLDPSRYASRRRMPERQTAGPPRPAQSKPAESKSAEPEQVTDPRPAFAEPLVIVPVPNAGEPPPPATDELAPLGNEPEPLVPVVTASVTPGPVEPPPPAPTPKLEIETPPAPKPKVELAEAPIRAAKPKDDAPDLGVHGKYWVQLAGSGTRANMASEYRRIRAKQPDLFTGRSGHVTVGKDYFRLVVGPFDSASEAQALVTRLDKAGIDSFAWTRNPAQIKIEKLAAR
jgi:Flp pilus assembly protein TadD